MKTVGVRSGSRPAGSLASPARTSTIRMCRRCEREILPKQFGNALSRDVLRKAADGMTTEPDAQAEKIKARRERKKGGRYMTHATLGDTVKLLLRGATLPATPISEECEDCLKLRAS